MKSTKEAISQQKTPKSIHSWPNHFWNPIENVSVKVQVEVSQGLKLAEKHVFFSVEVFAILRLS